MADDSTVDFLNRCTHVKRTGAIKVDQIQDFRGSISGKVIGLTA
jgi:hypothetical protein